MPTKIISDYEFVKSLVSHPQILNTLLEKGLITKEDVNLINGDSLTKPDLTKFMGAIFNDKEILSKAFNEAIEIPERVLLKLNKEYTKRLRKKHSHPRRGRQGYLGETAACWFSLEELRQFMEMNGLNINNPSDMGVRIYIGMYPKEAGPDYDGMLTAILVPTYKNGEVFDQDVIVEDFPVSPQGNNSFFVSIAGPGKDGGGGGGEEEVAAYLAFNHGRLCPPNSNCDGARYIVE